MRIRFTTQWIKESFIRRFFWLWNAILSGTYNLGASPGWKYSCPCHLCRCHKKLRLPSPHSLVNYNSPVLFYRWIKTPLVLIHWRIKTSIRKLRLTQKNEKNKVKWYSLSDTGFYFFVLIYILKIYCKKSSSILLRKNMFNSLLAFFFWKACTFSSFERFLCWKSRNYSQIYLSRIINYWDSILTLYLTWGAFSLVCVPFFFLYFFFFYRYFSW